MLCFGTKTSNAAMGWLVVIICGALMYASNDLQFSIQGYLWSFAHIISMTFYLTLVKRISSSSQPVTPALSSLLNNLTFLPILLLSVSRQTFAFVSVQMLSSSSASPLSSSSSNVSLSSSVSGELSSFIASSVTCLQSSPHKVLLPLILSCLAGKTLEHVLRS